MSDRATSSRYASAPSSSPGATAGGGPQFYPDLSQLTSGLSRTFIKVVRETKRTSLVHNVVGVLLCGSSNVVLLSLRFTQYLLRRMVGRSRDATAAGDADILLAFTPLGLIVKINSWVAIISLKIILVLLSHFPGHPPTANVNGRNDPISALTRSSSKGAEELFYIEKGVQIFYLQPDGTVHSPPQSTSLRVLQFHVPEEQQEDNAAGTAVLQVGDWNYPLLPGASPSLSADYGAYIFPNLGVESPDACVGIIFSQTVPQEARGTFDRIIKRLTSSQDAAVSQMSSVQHAAAQSEERQAWHSRAIGEHLIKGGEFTSDKIVELSQCTGTILRARSERLQESISPESRSTFRIQWFLLKSLETPNWAAGKACECSARMVDAVGRMTVALAKRLTASLSTTGSIFVPSSYNASNTKAGIVSASNVYVSLKNAAVTLAQSLADESVSVIDVKYGVDAAQAARLGASFLGNSVMTGYSLSNIAIGPKGIARRAVTNAGRDVLRGNASERQRSGPSSGRNQSPTRRNNAGNSNTADRLPVKRLVPASWCISRIFDYLPISAKCLCLTIEDGLIIKDGLIIEDGLMTNLANDSIDKLLNRVRNKRYLINHHDLLESYRKQLFANYLLFDNCATVVEAISSFESFLMDELEQILPQLVDLSTFYVKLPSLSCSSSYIDRIRSAVTEILKANARTITTCGFLHWPMDDEFGIETRIDIDEKSWSEACQTPNILRTTVFNGVDIIKWITGLPQLDVWYIKMPELDHEYYCEKVLTNDTWRPLRSTNALPHLRYVVFLDESGHYMLRDDMKIFINPMPQVKHVWLRYHKVYFHEDRVMCPLEEVQRVFPSIASYAHLTILNLDLSQAFSGRHSFWNQNVDIDECDAKSQAVLRYLQENDTYFQLTKVHLRGDLTEIIKAADKFEWCYTLLVRLLSNRSGCACNIYVRNEYASVRKFVDLFRRYENRLRSPAMYAGEMPKRHKATLAMTYVIRRETRDSEDFKRKWSHLIVNDNNVTPWGLLGPAALVSAYRTDKQKPRISLMQIP